MKSKYKGQLVFQYVDKISRQLLEKYREIIRDIARGKHGIYALYKDEKIYYVGLASNLRQRLRHHLRDRHMKTWNKFSIYLTTSSENLKDLESLFLRIFKPIGNNKVGKFLKAKNLKRSINAKIRELQVVERKTLMGEYIVGEHSKRCYQEQNSGGNKIAVLARYSKKKFRIRMIYKGKIYIAHVRKDGIISFDANSAAFIRLKGKLFKSPSGAGKALTERTCDGWRRWKYERSPGEWVLLDELRKK